MSFFSALYMLWNVLIVNISCKHCYNFSKKKKKKKKQTRTLVWVKMSKVMPQIPCYLSFLLGIPMPQTLYKAIKFASAFSDLTPPARTKLDKGVNDACQNCLKYVNYVCFFT